MGTLIIKMPSRIAADQVEHWIELPCAYAYPLAEGGVGAEGIKPLSSLANEIAAARRLVIVIAASDVTVLRIKVPPLSQTQLLRALPSLVEDRLLSDPAECTIVPGPVEDGWCTVAVVQRIWLELLSRTVNAYGASAVVAVPGQLCLAHENDVVVASLSEDEREIMFKTDPHDGFGLPVEPPPSATPQPTPSLSSAQHALDSAIAMIPEALIKMYVQARSLPAIMTVCKGEPERYARITPVQDDWAHMIKGIGQVEMNLLAGAANAATAHRRDWRIFRMVYAMAALFVIVNLVGLNAEWLMMRHEAGRLRDEMAQMYRNAFPNDKVVVDPLLQMQRHIVDAGRADGNLAPDDFLALLSRFGQGWSTAQPGSFPSSSIARLEYRERNLIVTLQPGSNPTMEKVQAAAGKQRLLVSQSGADAWQIRSAP